ncbi:hypothetical protein NDU88_001758 [Pleurodeles waltl]|uniref:Uncharacterized protein n=1 Tax=Pleurodeles waltl TaxID=8319 RepID=A0AAV7MKP2_PLEWA|nr:hypothetical protein NDU88_001758 [Pleurodeles waltl]
MAPLQGSNQYRPQRLLEPPRRHFASDQLKNILRHHISLLKRENCAIILKVTAGNMKLALIACLLALCAAAVYGQCTQYTYRSVRCVNDCRADGDGSYQCMISGGAFDYCSPSNGVSYKNVRCASSCAKKVNLFGQWYECKTVNGDTQYCGFCSSRPAA